MAEVQKTVLVHHSAEKMYDLVDKVEHYPEFLPWCGGVNIEKYNPAETQATIHIDFHHIKQSFTTLNLKTPSTQMEMKLVKGPFKHLNGSWQFIALNEEACKIIFTLHYEFSSKIIEKIIGPVFSHITNTFVDCFIHRADALYDHD